MNEDWSDALVKKFESNPELEFRNEQIGIERMFESNYALLSEDTLMRYYLRGNCNASEIPIAVFPTFGHLPYRKNFPFANIIDEQ